MRQPQYLIEYYDRQHLCIERVERAVKEAVEGLIKTSTPGKTDNVSPWLSTADLCQYLGISKPTVHRWRAQKGMPHHSVGGRTFFHRREIDDFITKSNS
jgi:excisionase family DNA binding protein